MIKNEGKTAYSDKELDEFRTLINNKLHEATREYEYLVGELRNFSNNGTDDTVSSMKIMEDGSDTNLKEEIGVNAVRLKKFIDNLRAALFRIENRTYGICQMTGKLIPKERLLAVPHTTKSIEAKQGVRK